MTVSWGATLVGIAALMLGKYLPGKVAGLAGRALTISAKAGLVSAGILTAIEQLYLVAGLIVFSALASHALPGSEYQSWLWVAPVVALLTIIGPKLSELWLECLGSRIQHVLELTSVLRRLSPLTSLSLLSLAVIISAAVCAPAWLLPEMLSIEVQPEARRFLVAAYGVSIMAGMVTLILPGGIGAREAAFVLLAQSVLTLEVAMVAAALLRLINVSADLIIGAIGFAAWKIRCE